MKHLKHFKKLKIFLLSATLLLSSGVFTVCHCVPRHKKTFKGQTFTFINDRRLRERIEMLKLSLIKREAENPGIAPPIIVGGRYESVPHAKGYESHHLISAHFCRNHRDIISVKDAPSVLILKNIHKFTGSFGGGNGQYFEEEEEAYRAGGLEAVLELGISDLNKVVRRHYASYKFVSPTKFTPFKRAKAILQQVDPTAYPQEDLGEFVTTPLKAKIRPRRLEF